MVHIPQLNSDIEVTVFDSKTNDVVSGNSRYLVQLEHTNFIVSQGIKNLIDVLILKPENIEQLSNYYQKISGKKTNGDMLLSLIEEHIPDSIRVGAELPAVKTPFVYSKTIFSTALVKIFCSKLTWLFKPYFVFAVMLIFAFTHIYTLPQILESAHSGWPDTNLIVFFPLMLLAFLWHELGHASACTLYDCRHGGIGCGIYFIFPVFYADVTSAWKLNKKKRAIIDVGGLYFQCLMLIIIDLYALTYNSPLAYKLSWTITFTMLYTLNPFFKFDGYWLLSDLSGVINLHDKMRSTLNSILSPLVKLKKPKLPTGKERNLLLAYSIMSLMFMGYFLSFLTKEITKIINTLPSEIELWYAIYDQLAGYSFEAVEVILNLSLILIWPILIFIFSFFYLFKIFNLVLSKPKEATQI